MNPRVPFQRRLLARWLFIAALAIATAAVVGPDAIGLAQVDHSTVVRVLRHGRDFRARTRAALALGASADPSVVPHLAGALRDENQAVRAAAATALGRLGNRQGLPALQRAARDRSRVVRHEVERAIQRIEAAIASRPTRLVRPARSRERYPEISVVPRARRISWPRIRYVVVVGSMENRSDFESDSLGAVLQQEVLRNLLVLRGVAVIRAGEESAETATQIRRRRLPKLRLEGSLTSVERQSERRQLSVRCEVSIMLLDDNSRNIRGMLRGAATGSGPRAGRRNVQERALAQQALEGAVRSAMTGAARAITSASRY